MNTYDVKCPICGALERYIAPTAAIWSLAMKGKRMGRRHDRIDIYAPAAQEHI